MYLGLFHNDTLVILVSVKFSCCSRKYYSQTTVAHFTNSRPATHLVFTCAKSALASLNSFWCLYC